MSAKPDYSGFNAAWCHGRFRRLDRDGIGIIVGRNASGEYITCLEAATGERLAMRADGNPSNAEVELMRRIFIGELAKRRAA
jgi:hypothetical protein